MSRPNILALLDTDRGCLQIQQMVALYLESTPWAPIDQMNDALENDLLLIPLFSTIYSAKPNGKFQYSQTSLLSIVEKTIC